MIEVERGGVRHRVYEKGEADALGMSYVDWRSGWAGVWVLSDDGYVLEALMVKEYYDKQRSRKSLYDVWSRWLICAMGKVNSNMRVMEVLKMVRNRKELGGVPWDIRFVRSQKGRDWMSLAAGMLLNGEVDYIVLCRPLGRVSRPRYLVRKYLYNTVIRSGIFAVMSTLLKSRDLDYNAVLERYEDIYRKAMADGKYTDALKILQKYEDWTGLRNAIQGEQVGASGESTEIEERFAQLSRDREARVLHSGEKVVDFPSRTEVYAADGTRVTVLPDPGEDEDE